MPDDKDLPKIEKLEGGAVQRHGATTLAIPVQREVDALMRQLPQGKPAATRP